jgi:transposase
VARGAATVKVAHVRLYHSHILFVRAYPRETQEMAFDAHNRAFAFFKGTLRQSMDASRRKMAARDARIYPACCWSSRAPGLDRTPLPPAS